MKEAHIQCDICKKDYPYMVYRDYPALRQHFEASHYFCKEQECIDNMTVVFATKEELDFHFNKAHNKNRLGKNVNANALLGVRMDDDDDGDDAYLTQNQRGSRGGRGGGGRGGRGGASLPVAPKGAIQIYDKIGKDYTKIVNIMLIISSNSVKWKASICFPAL